MFNSITSQNSVKSDLFYAIGFNKHILYMCTSSVVFHHWTKRGEKTPLFSPANGLNRKLRSSPRRALDPARHRHRQYARRRQELPTRQGRVSHRSLFSPPQRPGSTQTTEGRNAGTTTRQQQQQQQTRTLHLDTPMDRS